MRNQDMTPTSKKKKRSKRWKGFAIIGFVAVLLLGYGVYWAFYDMDRLPTGEYLTEETSPDGRYTLKAYVTNGGATTAYSIRGELVVNDKDVNVKNIYWNYREETADISWQDNDTVIINGYSLDVLEDKFDFRNQ